MKLESGLFPLSFLALATSLATGLFTVTAHAETFTHDPPGQLVPDSGAGRKDTKIYAPDMRFPIESGPAFANSQVWGHGGMNGPGDQCDKENFSYPWHDNYCESRDWDMPLCPAGTGHQGQDVRAATCEKGVHWVVAVADGTITSIGSYSVYLTAPDGTRYDYLHMSDVAVKEGDEVKRGQHVGKVANVFGDSTTTVHLHFNIRQNVAGVGSVFVPPYTSLIAAYDELMTPKPQTDAGPSAEVPADPPAEEAPTAPAPPAAQDADTGCTSAPGSFPTGAFGLVLGMATVFAVRRRRASRSSTS